MEVLGSRTLSAILRRAQSRLPRRPPSPVIVGDNVDTQQLTVEVAQEFHRRMAAIINAVQAGIWKSGGHNLLGYATDYASGPQQGLQTLVLKTRNRSAYVRLQWDAVLGDAPADRNTVDDAVRNAINELQ